MSLGPLALTYILTVGGAGYFRAGTVTPFLTKRELFLVHGAPEFSHSAYVVYIAERNEGVLERAREGMRIVARHEGYSDPGQSIAARPLRARVSPSESA